MHATVFDASVLSTMRRSTLASVTGCVDGPETSLAEQPEAPAAATNPENTATLTSANNFLTMSVASSYLPPFERAALPSATHPVNTLARQYDNAFRPITSRGVGQRPRTPT